MIQLVLLRHGESISNRDGYFTGWNDVALSHRGEHQAEQAGRLLKEAGCEFDICFTSELRRATDTSRIVLSAMGLDGLTTRQSWRLNERHYGALEGVHRINAIGKFGIWPVLSPQLRFTAVPPPLGPDDARCPRNQPRYSDVDKNELPLAESMQQTHSRVLPYWQETIVPEILRGKRVLVVSHRHVLRSLMMQLDGLSVSQLMKLSIATGRPLVYNLDHELGPVQHYYADRQSA
ncbi:2,3-diphosphoglycerate-dependent phosphoglycerate mutase [Nitrosospira sp. Nsp13]|uniref:2,3-bisphosphoglycerate-dependent phosphoglycerate mutase n=1 Tax=Nitrosospira sp. Nsp13 TaxID=1855332 RepID=UPI0008916135|nr:2,3-bisphosphoglycerate-dependent phosphoglycerate mutase [Nitrosospira sp. Nsp13]SCY61248.1 phosphoglycerate mutase [Nitrosospira sp. Nsp13]